MVATWTRDTKSMSVIDTLRVSFGSATCVYLVISIVCLPHSDAVINMGNPDAKRLYDDLLSNYNKLVRPVQNTTDPLTVRIKLKLSQLIDVVSRPTLDHFKLILHYNQSQQISICQCQMSVIGSKLHLKKVNSVFLQQLHIYMCIDSRQNYTTQLMRLKSMLSQNFSGARHHLVLLRKQAEQR